jgi:hypothetical protein
MRALWICAGLALASCGDSPPAKEPPQLRLDDDGEIYVADVVSRLGRGRFDLVELMMHEQSTDRLAKPELEAMWQALVDELGAPEGRPRLLKVGTIPITRDDGTIGFFGEARFEMLRGVGELRLEIACAEHIDAAKVCKPPYRIVALQLGAQGQL